MKFKQALTLMGIATLFPVLNHADSICASAAGNWIDNYNYVWLLSQNATGQLSGTVTLTVETGCTNPKWNVSGSFTGSGNFDVTATNPSANVDTCGPFFVYSGSINKPGCSTGNGTWSNPDFSGTWSWSMACSVPSNETTTPLRPNGTNANYVWRGTLQPTSVNYGGRTISEAVTGTDACRQKVGLDDDIEFSASADISTSNSYEDIVGYQSDNVTFFRMMGATPCSFTATQQLTIDCPNSQQSYDANQLGGSITATTVSSSRDGQTVTRTF